MSRSRTRSTRPQSARLGLALLAATTVVSFLAPAAQAGQQSTGGAPAPTEELAGARAVTGPKPQPQDLQHSREAAFEALIDRARAHGPVRVTLTVADLPQAAPDSAAERLAVRSRVQEQAVRGRAAVLDTLGEPAAEASDGPVPPAMSVEAGARQLSRLRALPQVRAVTATETVDVSGTTSFGAADGVQLPTWWHRNRIGLGWTVGNGYTGSGRTVVVIDTGVDTGHGWLRGRIAGEACFSQSGCGNGQTYRYGTGASAPCTYAWLCAHGTHVAHIAAGQYGAAPGARIVAIQASSKGVDKYGRPAPTFQDVDLVNALWYVYYHVAPIPASVNMSLGGGAHTTTCDGRNPSVTSYISALRNAGVPTVISSGNENYTNAVGFPACVSSAVVVGNTTMTAASGGYDAVFSGPTHGSNSSSLVDLLAPGTDICSAVPTYLDYDGTADGRACDYVGTSMAAPQVAGAWAVMRSARSGYTLNQVLSALQRNGTAVTDSRNGITRARLNVANSVYYG